MSGAREAERRPERRRSGAQQVLLRSSNSSLVAGMARPLAEALRRLEPDSARIGTAWRRLLRSLAPTRSEFDDLAALNPTVLWRAPPASDFEAHAEALQREGQALASRGVPEEQAVAALALYLECCLARLSGEGLKEQAGALARLTASIQRGVLSGYARSRAVGWHRVDDRDRKELSRDLHDEVGTDLVVLKLYIEMIALEIRTGDLEVASAKVQEALGLVSHALESVRRLTLDLGPAILEQVGLVPAVKLYGRHFSSRTGIAVNVQDADVPERLPHGHEATLYRVLQGALSNVAKHSKARHVRVALGSVRRAVLVMVIEDDGIGFEVKQRATESAFGITAMRDRVHALGGRLHIESRQANSGGGRSGTRIEIDLPVSAEEAT